MANWCHTDLIDRGRWMPWLSPGEGEEVIFNDWKVDSCANCDANKLNLVAWVDCHAITGSFFRIEKHFPKVIYVLVVDHKEGAEGTYVYKRSTFNYLKIEQTVSVGDCMCVLKVELGKNKPLNAKHMGTAKGTTHFHVSISSRKQPWVQRYNGNVPHEGFMYSTDRVGFISGPHLLFTICITIIYQKICYCHKRGYEMSSIATINYNPFSRPRRQAVRFVYGNNYNQLKCFHMFQVLHRPTGSWHTNSKVQHSRVE